MENRLYLKISAGRDEVSLNAYKVGLNVYKVRLNVCHEEVHTIFHTSCL